MRKRKEEGHNIVVCYAVAGAVLIFGQWIGLIKYISETIRDFLVKKMLRTDLGVYIVKKEIIHGGK